MEYHQYVHSVLHVAVREGEKTSADRISVTYPLMSQIRMSKNNNLVKVPFVLLYPSPFLSVKNTFIH